MDEIDITKINFQGILHRDPETGEEFIRGQFYRGDQSLVLIDKFQVKGIEHINKLQKLSLALTNLKHPNILEFKGYTLGGSGSAASYGIFVMEYPQNGSLTDELTGRLNAGATFSEEELKYHFRCLTHVFATIESKGYIHGDIHPGNLHRFYGEGVCWFKVRMSQYCRESGRNPEMKPSNSNYWSPEMQNGTSSSPLKSDVYALGLVFLEMVFLRKDFDDSNIEWVLTYCNYSESIKNILREFLHPQEQSRKTFIEILQSVFGDNSVQMKSRKRPSSPTEKKTTQSRLHANRVHQPGSFSAMGNSSMKPLTRADISPREPVRPQPGNFDFPSNQSNLVSRFSMKTHTGINSRGPVRSQVPTSVNRVASRPQDPSGTNGSMLVEPAIGHNSNGNLRSKELNGTSYKSPGNYEQTTGQSEDENLEIYRIKTTIEVLEKQVRDSTSVPSKPELLKIVEEFKNTLAQGSTSSPSQNCATCHSSEGYVNVCSCEKIFCQKCVFHIMERKKCYCERRLSGEAEKSIKKLKWTCQFCSKEFEFERICQISCGCLYCRNCYTNVSESLKRQVQVQSIPRKSKLACPICKSPIGLTN